jgi:hypothetical protein
VRGLGPRAVATCSIGDVCQRESLEVLTHVVTGLFPDRKENALPFMVAGAVLMRFAEVAKSDRSVDCRNDLAQSDVFGRACEGVPASDTALGLHEPSALQGEQDLFQVRLGESCSFGDVLDGSRTRIVGVQSQRQQGSTGIVASGGHSHVFIVGAMVPDRRGRAVKNLEWRMESRQSIRDSGNSRLREIAILAIRDYGKSRFWQSEMARQWQSSIMARWK